MQDRLGEEGTRGQEVGDADIAVAELLLHQALRHEVGHPTTTVFSRQHVGGQTDVGGLLPQVKRRLDVSLVDLARAGADLPFGEVTGQRNELLLLVCQVDAIGDGARHARLLRNID